MKIRIQAIMMIIVEIKKELVGSMVSVCSVLLLFN